MVAIGLSFAGVAGAQTAQDSLEPNDDRSSAVNTGSGDSYDDLTIHDSEDEDYYAVEAEAGERITADIEFTDDNGDIDLELQDASGSYLDGSISVSDGESVEYIADSDGTYYVRVYGFGGATNSYDITTDTTETDYGGEDSLEPNDDQSSATQLGSGGSYENLTVHNSEDQDYFAVDATAGDTISADIEFSDTSGDIDMDLEDSSGTALDSSYSVSDDESVEYTVQSNGTYYVRVHPWSGAPNGYNISVETTEGDVDTSGDSLEPNDDRASATQLGSGGSYENLAVDSDEDEDFFSVEATAGDTISADIEFADANGDIDLQLQDASGSYLTGSNSISDDESIEYTVQSDGTYYVRVYPWSGAPNSYNISVETTEGSSDDDQIQDGDDLRSISSGETAQGTIDTSDPTVEGYYHEPVTFDGESGQAVNIDMESETGDAYLVLQAPDGSYVEYNDDGGDGLNSQISGYTLTQTGQYTIIATSFSGDDTFDYTLTLEESGDVDSDAALDALESNDDRSSATQLGSGGSYENLTLHSTNDEDFFEITVSEGETITADIEFIDDNGDIDLELQDASGSYLEGSYSVSNDESIEYTAESSGTYYIRVHPWSGVPNSYDISVSTSGSGAETNEDLSLSANTTATASGDMRVTFDLENTGSETQAVILNAGDGVDSLGSGYEISNHTDDGGAWRSSEGSWLFQSLSAGDSVSPSVTVDVPEDAQGTRIMSVSAESDAGTTTTTVELDLDDIGIAQAADTNNNGALEDSEILAAIEAWRTDSTISDTDTTVSNDQIIDLISTWRESGS